MIDQASGGTLRRRTCLQRILWCGGLVVSGLAAASSPPPPTELKATPNGHIEVDISFRSDASMLRNLIFEPEVTENGGPSVARNPPLSRVEDGSPYFMGAYRGLSPNIKYCIRYRARDVASKEVGAPSEWACARTIPDPPPTPVNVGASVTVIGVIKPRPQVVWHADPRSYDRGTVRFTVERQGPTGPGWPWILQVDFNAGPDPGRAVDAATPFEFSKTVAPIDPKLHYIYRVCVQNYGGTACARPVDLVIQASPLGARATPPVSAPGAFGSPKVITFADQKLQGQAMSRPSTQTDRPLNWETGSASERSKFPPSTTGLAAPSAIGPRAAPAHAPDRTAPHVINPDSLPLDPVTPAATGVESGAAARSLSR